MTTVEKIYWLKDNTFRFQITNIANSNLWKVEAHYSFEHSKSILDKDLDQALDKIIAIVVLQKCLRTRSKR